MTLSWCGARGVRPWKGVFDHPWHTGQYRSRWRFPLGRSKALLGTATKKRRNRAAPKSGARWGRTGKVELLQLIVGGIAQGCVYGLIALGFVLIYKATEMVNFAQGDMMML